MSAFNVSATRTVFAKHVETPCQALGDATRTRTAGGDPSLVPHAAAHRQNTVKGALRQKHRLFEQPRRTRTSSKRPVLSLEADLHRWSSHTNRPRVKIAALRAPSQPVTPVWKYLPLHGLRRRKGGEKPLRVGDGLPYDRALGRWDTGRAGACDLADREGCSMARGRTLQIVS